MNEKLTPQEAALYLGQEIQYPDVDGRLTTAKLIGVSQDEGLTTEYNCARSGITGDILSFRSNSYHNSDALHAKLLLRPLSDITEEEAMTLYYRDFKNYDHMKRLNRGIAFYGKSSHGEVKITTVDFDRLRPGEFIYLLSKGFDLFNWIEQGKALDKTKLTTQN